jgi:hypothetical protein
LGDPHRSERGGVQPCLTTTRIAGGK